MKIKITEELLSDIASAEQAIGHGKGLIREVIDAEKHGFSKVGRGQTPEKGAQDGLWHLSEGIDYLMMARRRAGMETNPRKRRARVESSRVSREAWRDVFKKEKPPSSEIMRSSPSFVIEHLAAWIRSLPPSMQEGAKETILAYIAQHPSTIDVLSWPEVLDLAKREGFGTKSNPAPRARRGRKNPGYPVAVCPVCNKFVKVFRGKVASHRYPVKRGRPPEMCPGEGRPLEPRDISITRGPLPRTPAEALPRFNPSIVSGELWAAPGMRPPKTMALLGELLELVIQSPAGEERTIRAKENTAALLAPGGGDVLWMVWPSSARRAKMPGGSGAVKRLYRKWSKFDPEVSIKFAASDKFPGSRLGIVKVIRYRSDKWTGEPTAYEHKFSADVFAYANNAKKPTMIVAFVPAHSEREKVILVSDRGLIH